MNNDGLDNNKTDIIVAALKGSAGAIPYAGGIAAELIGNLVPNQRMDRLVIYVRDINERLETLEEQAKQKLFDAEAIDIFEDGAHQAVRALSPERQEYIANLVTFGMTGEQHARLQAKRLLNLLKELDDDQIIILASYLNENMYNKDFKELHKDIISLPSINMHSSKEDVDKTVIGNLALTQLNGLGLLNEKYEVEKRPNYNIWGNKTDNVKIKAKGYEITPLGRLLLRNIGV